MSLRRHPDLNWGIKDLQSSALPLGYTAILIVFNNKNNIYYYTIKKFLLLSSNNKLLNLINQK
jgi:hypothetical protein